MKKFLQGLIYTIIQPLVDLLIRLKVTPNQVTTAGFLINVVAAVVMIRGGERGEHSDLTPLGWGGGLILFAGLFDMIDGRLARVGKMATRYGALYDSVLDRYSELVMFLGFCYFLVARHYFLGSLIAFIGLIGSMMVSYVRARSEGLGIDCREGMMQRPERVVTLGLSALVCGIVASVTGGNQKLFAFDVPFAIIETISIFIYPMAFVAILSNLTAIQRLLNSKHELERKDRTGHDAAQ